VSTQKKSVARMPRACARRNCRQLGPSRRGAGSMPAGWKSTRRYLPRSGSQARRVRRGCRRLTPGGLLGGQPSTNRRSSGTVRRPPLRWCRGGVQRRFTRSWCQRTIVAGVTMRCRRQTGDSNRATAANTARSAQDSRGLLTWRRHTATPWRSTRISRSLIVRCGPAVPARPSLVGRLDTAVVPPRPTIMADGHRTTMPQITVMDDQFGAHRIYPRLC
jgi:hypothetical protein